MNGTNIALAIIIIIIFILLFICSYYILSIERIKKNWPKYRCHPSIIPFASFFGHNTLDNFVYCIQNLQTNYMSYLLHPLNYNLNVLGNIGETIVGALDHARSFLNNIRHFMADMVSSIFGIFTNILVAVFKLIINFKDLLSKIVAVLATSLYLVTGSMNTMSSAWDGPPGELVRALCFHPDTKVRLKDNSLKKMKDLSLNDILKTGSIVQAVMNITNININNNNEQIEDIYKIKDGENKEDILVSGSHLIYDPNVKGFVQVKHFRGENSSIKTDIKCNELCCLITSDNTIPIGKWIFHDWEDNNGSNSKNIV